MERSEVVLSARITSLNKTEISNAPWAKISEDTSYCFILSEVLCLFLFFFLLLKPADCFCLRIRPSVLPYLQLTDFLF